MSVHGVYVRGFGSLWGRLRHHLPWTLRSLWLLSLLLRHLLARLPRVAWALLLCLLLLHALRWHAPHCSLLRHLRATHLAHLRLATHRLRHAHVRRHVGPVLRGQRLLAFKGHAQIIRNWLVASKQLVGHDLCPELVQLGRQEGGLPHLAIRTHLLSPLRLLPWHLLPLLRHPSHHGPHALLRLLHDHRVWRGIHATAPTHWTLLHLAWISSCKHNENMTNRKLCHH